MKNKTDLRILKTCENIKRTFSQLLLEKSFKEITVQNICDKALIGRSTFYDHYYDKYDLLTKMVEEILMELKPYIQNRFNFENSQEFVSIGSSMLNYFKNKKITIQALLSVHTETTDFSANIKNILVEECSSYLEHTGFKSKFNISNDYICYHYASYVLTSFQLWFQFGENLSSLDLAYEIQDVLFASK
ncbi:TetR/AcrR family transcriptional regulator [Clostridium sp. SHJSY1]|uniref:TetR/AcrR family transcriptional regulator n=1 Tax=Clostridium sp. SHJSY1 TaxID=2942483 RepID=UPI0028765656|nr:TetR/AcrR family transcriptional regulator [Clostridium sp. SHJSY1]MDS0524333.1 TetR/AcrR family transcriptional regulator [Clostridium sp. SHJSY1]